MSGSPQLAIVVRLNEKSCCGALSRTCGPAPWLTYPNLIWHAPKTELGCEKRWYTSVEIVNLYVNKRRAEDAPQGAQFLPEKKKSLMCEEKCTFRRLLTNFLLKLLLKLMKIV